MICSVFRFSSNTSCVSCTYLCVAISPTLADWNIRKRLVTFIYDIILFFVYQRPITFIESNYIAKKSVREAQNVCKIKLPIVPQSKSPIMSNSLYANNNYSPLNDAQQRNESLHSWNDIFNVKLTYFIFYTFLIFPPSSSSPFDRYTFWISTWSLKQELN